MEIPTDYLEKIRRRRDEKGLPRSEREELLDLFLARLNAARVVDGLPKMTHARLATALTKIPTGDLHAFYNQCDQARHFSRFFWWSLKPKPA